MYSVNSITGLIFTQRLPWKWEANGLLPIWERILIMAALYFGFGLIIAARLWQDKAKRNKANGVTLNGSRTPGG
jgi:Ni/Fe-hydrogenase subunit HybB-like protein